MTLSRNDFRHVHAWEDARRLSTPGRYMVRCACGVQALTEAPASRPATRVAQRRPLTSSRCGVCGYPQARRALGGLCEACWVPDLV